MRLKIMGDQTKSDCCLTKCGTHNKCFLYTSCWLSFLHHNNSSGGGISRSSNKITKGCQCTVDATLPKHSSSTKMHATGSRKLWTRDNLAGRWDETISHCQPKQPKNPPASQLKAASCNNSQRKLNGAAKSQLYGLGYVAL